MDAYSNIRIIGTGHDVPPALTNADVLRVTNIGNKITPEWIERKIRIKQRHTCLEIPINPDNPRPAENMRNSDLAVRAILKAHEMAAPTMGSLDNLDAIFYSSCTPDYPVPPTSSIVMEKLGLNDIFTVDIRSACCGSSLALISALQYLATGQFNCVAVVGCDTGSPFGSLDFTGKFSDKKHIINALMIGDGAGAMILKRFEEGSDVPKNGIEVRFAKSACIGKDKKFGMSLLAGGSARPFSRSVLEDGSHFFQHDFANVLRHGPQLYMKGLSELSKNCGLTHKDMDLIIPHQANGNVSEIGRGLGVDPEKMHEHFSMYGNTANASLLIALDLEVRRNQLRDGANVCMIAAESTKWLYSIILLKWGRMNVGKSKL